MNFVKKYLGLILLILSALTFCALYFGSPYLIVGNLQNAVKNNNDSEVSSYIDFTALKNNLKNQLINQIDLQFAEEKQKPLKGILAALSYQATDALVDEYVSPKGISDLLKGVKNFQAYKDLLKEKTASLTEKQAVPTEGLVNAKSATKTPKISWKLSYGDTFNQFFIVLDKNNDPSNKLTISLVREGFFNWKVNNILLPF